MKDGTQYKYDELIKNKRSLTYGTDSSIALSLLKGIIKGKSNTIEDLRKYASSQGDDRTLEFIDEIADIWSTDKKGNIYEVEGPENDVLLDLDALLEDQPAHVKKAINKLMAGLKRNKQFADVDLSAIPNLEDDTTISLDEAETGLDLYFGIAKTVLAHYLNEHGIPLNLDEMTNAEREQEKKLWVEAKKATSLMFNKFGVPGLRFLDKASRRAGEGTHNFVIWDTDTLKIIGITPDSDEDAIDYFEQHKGFITPERLEQYNQLITVGSSNIIIGNRYDLRYLGTGEGNASFGWGAYFAQARGTVEHYRKFGLPNAGLGTLHVYTNDGKEFIANRKAEWGKLQKGALQDVLNDVQELLVVKRYKTIEDVKTALIDKYREGIKSISARNARKKAQEKLLANLQEKIDNVALVTGFEFTNPKKGNIYIFDIPEAYEVLDWDVTMLEQPKQVLEKLKNAGLYLDEYETGQQLYKRLARELNNGKRSDRLASLKLNEIGIPGLRYLDSGSRDAAISPNARTYDYVIWNEDRMHMVGIDPDSDQDAIDYYNRTKAEQEQAKVKADRTAREIGNFGQDTIEQYFQRWGRSPAEYEDVQRLLERNRRAEPAFRRLMSEIQQELGGELITRKQMKSPERIVVKANRAFGGDISKVGDVWAATLVFDTEDEVLDAIIKFRKRNDIVHQANRWSKPKRSTGYRDFEAHLELDDGTVVELQIQHRGIQDVKDGVGHSLYEFITNNGYNYELSDYTWQAGDISKKLYAAALGGSYAALSDWRKGILRKLGEKLAQASTSEEAEEAINALQDFVDTMMPQGVTVDRTAPADRHSPDLDPIAAKYLYETADSVVLPLDVLIQSRQVDRYSVSRARRNMQSALNGYKSKRKPLTARSNGDGTYYLIDGNDTYAVLKELGAKNAPVTLIGGSPYDGQPDTYRSASSREQFSQSSVRYDAVSSSTNARDLSGARRYTRPDGIKSSGMSYSPSRYSTANGAPSLLMKYSNILNNSNPDDIDFDNLTTGNEGFITSETIERFNQPSLQGTGHIIIGNRMDLSKIGTGEGYQAFGWGIYSAQLREVAETYRLYGVPNLGVGTIHIHTNDDSVYSADNLDNWGSDIPKHVRLGLNYFLQTACHRQLAAQNTNTVPNLENIKSIVKDRLEHFNGRDKQGHYIPGWKVIMHKAIEFVDTINSFNFTPDKNSGKKGNIYILDVPEDNILLDWDADLVNQPKDIIKAIGNVTSAAEDLLSYIEDGYTDDEEFYEAQEALYKAHNGEDLYEAITKIMKLYVEYKTPKDGVTNPQQRTSLLFNKFGIPGLRYFDGGSRDEGEGTHNFVIWNEDAMQVLGLTEDSDQEAKDYFEQYKREHLDGFITPDAIEHFNQWVTHATGNIILGNRFDLRYVGSSEGSSAFGYGAYFEQNRAVAETYRRYGLKNNGYGDIHLRLKNGTVISSSAELVEDPDTWIKEWRTNWPDAPKDVSRELLDLLGGTIRAKDFFIRLHNSGEGYSDIIDEIKEYVIDRYSKGLQSTIAQLQKALQTDLDSLRREDFQYRTREQRLADIEDDKKNIARLQKELQNIDETIRPFINSIEEIDIDPNKRGNIYNFEIPEDYELLLWDAKLSEQSEQLKPIIHKIVDTFNNNPIEIIAFGFAQKADNPKTARTALRKIIHSIMKKYDLRSSDSFALMGIEFQKKPEYERLKRIIHNERDLTSLLFCLSHLAYKLQIDSSKMWGEGLYWKLVELTGSKIGASMYLNSQGIPGHKFLDRSSRNDDVEDKTYNFVIWNMDKVQMLGLDPDSDREAIDYFNEHQDRQLGLFSRLDALDGERYQQQIRNAGYDELERVMFRDKDGTEYTYKDRENISDFLAELARAELKREQGDKIPDLQEAARNLIRKEQDKLKVYQSNLEREKAKPDNKGIASIWQKRVRAQKEYIHRLKTSIPQSVELRPAANEVETYHQSVMRIDSFTLTAEARRQMNTIYNQYAGTDKWLKAPNGKPTKLTKQQWLAVRTPNFIRWFGDWLNDPEHASKVLDENGEPRVVYHGTDTEEISVFNTNGQERTKGSGAFFIGSEEVANTYVRGNLSHNNVYPVFLNIRNPYVLDGGNRYWSTLLEYHVYDNARDRNIFIKNDGTNFTSRDDAEDYIQNVLHDSNRYTVQEGSIMTTNEIARFVWKFKKGGERRFDGVIIKNILDVGTPPTRAFNPVSDEFIIPKPHQIKSATRNNGEYSLTDPDHYHQIIGEKGASALDRAEGVTIRMDALKEAKKLARKGEKALAIKRNTGWERGHDGKWKFEISDGNIKSSFINPETNTINAPINKDFKLIDIFDAPELYKAYPELKNYHLTFTNTGSFFDRDWNNLYIEVGMSPERTRSAILHEIQHAIQHIEGFALSFSRPRSRDTIDAGKLTWKHWDKKAKSIWNSLGSFEQDLWERLAEQVQYEYDGDYRYADDIKEYILSEYLDEEDQQRFIDWAVAVQEAGYNRYGEHTISGDDAYWRSAGEVEARNVEHRANLSPEQKAETALTETEDFKPAEDQIILKKDKSGREAFRQLVKQPDTLSIPEQQLEAVRRKYQGTKGWMKAPNGKPTNLTERQWLQVRTPNFINWFGDWLNDPDNASQVVDRNGEPLVVYHGSKVGREFAIFDTTNGAWFSDTRDTSDSYINGFTDSDYDNATYSVFLNIRNPMIIDYDGKGALDDGNEAPSYWLENSYGYDGVICLNIKDRGGRFGGYAEQDEDGNYIEYYTDTVYGVKKPTQIKSSTRNNGEYSPTNPDHYHQSSYTYYGVDADGRQLLLPFNHPEIDEVLEQYKGRLFKAPNGKKSKLDKRSWLLVHTPAFKAWFGDWENNPAEASKVLDENGEPLIVYHGTPAGGFSVFSTHGDGESKGTGAWFSSSEVIAGGYGPTRYQGGEIYPVFLNMRNPYIHDAHGRYWDSINTISIVNKHSGETITTDKHGIPFWSEGLAQDYIMHTLNDLFFEDWRIKADKIQTTNELVRAVRSKKLGNGHHDGVIIRNVIDAAHGNNTIADDYIIFKPLQAKSKHNRGSFSTSDRDVYHQIIGEKGTATLDRAEGVTWRMDDLKIARQMRKAGKDAKTIRLATGWERGADGSWKYEIMDGKLLNNHGRDNISLYKIFDAPELYKAYPELRNITVSFDIEEQDFFSTLFNTLRGSWDNKTKTLHLRKRELNTTTFLDEANPQNDEYARERLDELKSVIIHEVQHAIQDIEGFALGGSPELFYRKRQVARIDDRFLTGHDAYRHTAGEVESRNAQTRMNMPEEERNNTLLEDTEDVRRDEQFVFHNYKELDRDSEDNIKHDEVDELYHQSANLSANPLVERYSQLHTFGDADTEKKYSGSLSDNGSRGDIMQSLKDIFHGFKGDFPELAGNSKFTPAREILRMMDRKSDAKVLMAVKGLVQSVEGLNANQLNIFGRFMLLNDIETFRMQNPKAALPMGFTLQSFLAERSRFTELANNDDAIMKALRSEQSLHEQINNALASYAEKLGLPALADKVRHNDFYILEYSKMLKGEDINANYLQAVADTRAQQLRDIEHMSALLSSGLDTTLSASSSRSSGTTGEGISPKATAPLAR